MKKTVAEVPKITLKQLSVFVSIYQTGSTSLASEQLHLSQSAVSHALTELEDRLQMPLFERVGRRLSRHANATAVFVQAQAILGQALTLEHYHQHQAGQIRIGASTTIGNYALPPLLAQLYARLPDAHIDLYIANTGEVVTEIERLNIDLALVEGMPRPSDSKVIEQRAWRTDTLVLFAKAGSQWLQSSKDDPNQKDDTHGYRLSRHALAKLPLLVREAGSGTRQTVDEQLLQQLPEANTVMAVGQSEAIKNMVSADIGIGCLSRQVISAELAAGSLVEVEVAGIDLTRTWWLIWHKARHQSLIWQVFVDIITDKT